MNTVSRLDVESILPNEEYRAQRAAVRKRLLEVKQRRRIHLGDHLTFLFENAETLWYQVQEMLLTEGNQDPAAVRHEVSTYRELLGGPGELGCTLLIEIEDPGERDRKLRQWLELPHELFAILADGTAVPATFDERQIGVDRLSSVQYLKFDTKGEVPVALEWRRPETRIAVQLSDEQKAALAEDLLH